MGNASPGGKQQKGEGGHLPDCVAGTGWSEEDAALFERLLSHWQVAEGELQPADDVPALTVAGRTKFEDQVSVVRWRGDLLVLKRCQPPSALYQELGVWFRLRPHTYTNLVLCLAREEADHSCVPSALCAVVVAWWGSEAWCRGALRC